MSKGGSPDPLCLQRSNAGTAGGGDKGQVTEDVTAIVRWRRSSHGRAPPWGKHGGIYRLSETSNSTVSHSQPASTSQSTDQPTTNFQPWSRYGIRCEIISLHIWQLFCDLNFTITVYNVNLLARKWGMREYVSICYSNTCDVYIFLCFPDHRHRRPVCGHRGCGRRIWERRESHQRSDVRMRMGCTGCPGKTHALVCFYKLLNNCSICKDGTPLHCQTYSKTDYISRRHEHSLRQP